MFLGTYLFTLGYLDWQIVVFRSFLDPLYFCGISCNVSFCSDFIYLSLLSVFLN